MSTAGADPSPKLILVLGALTALGPLSIDAYLPALPLMELDLHVAPGVGSISLASYFLALAGAQLPWGALADSIGRRPVLLWGLALYVAGSLCCAVAPSLPALAAARFVQGLGGASSMVMTRTLVRDLWSGREMAKVMSLVTLVMGVAPVLAPLVGGGLLAFAGWRTIFVMLSAVGAALGVIAFLAISETRPAGHPEPLRAGLASTFTDRRFLAFSLAGGSASAGMFAYISGAPGVFIHQLGASPTAFALLFGLNASGLIGLSQYNRVLLARRTPQAIAASGIGLELGAASLLLAVALVVPSIPSIEVLLWVFVASLGLVTANTIALALEHQGRRAGLASALLGTLQFGISAVASALVSFFARETAVPMAAVMLGCALAAAALLAIGSHERRVA